MEFSGQYLNYEEYRSLGGTLDLTPFNLIEFETEKIINKHTLNRLVDLKEQGREVKKCVYDLIKLLTINGEYLDGNQETKRTMEEEIVNNNLLYYNVNGTHVLYRGI